MSDDLTVRLRELAETAEAPPPGSGAEVRAVAGRRRRRRRTSVAVAGGCAAAGLAAVLTLNAASHGTEQRPATAASGSASAVAAPQVTVDLSRRVLVYDGRELPITAGKDDTPTPTGLMHVTRKEDAVRFSGVTAGFGDEYVMNLQWVMELTPVAKGATPGGEEPGAVDARGTTGAGDTGDSGGDTGTGGRTSATPTPTPTPTGRPWTLWIAAIAHNEKAPGTLDVTSGWIGLRTADARWLFERLPEDAVVDIRNPRSTPTPTPSTGPSSG
ncbi:L,D-transpeptidase [Streptomyces sp. VNUA24]|uniref:L,D-transpeptidase n=1 Tax=Streptomyces sp. VNUA24 TaxID=3031131 RepID=UPI0023B79328|nr:L,D-transpeptidase [Streptomyces sp. VNUA24]WEH16632.1 L,D-transpeptidase [Streptomyces sp. VNUA24]